MLYDLLSSPNSSVLYLLCLSHTRNSYPSCFKQHPFIIGGSKMKSNFLFVSMIIIFLFVILEGLSYAIDPASAMGIWLFNDRNDVGIDLSGNGNDGDVEGDPKWIEKGKFGGGLHFDATDDVIKVPMTVDYDEITVMVWAQEEGSPVRPRIVSNDHTDVSMKGFQLMYNTAGSGSWFDVGNGSTRVGAQFAYLAKIGEWYHFTGTYDGSTVRAYIDGEQMAEAGGLSGSIGDSGIDVHIGTSTYAWSDAFKGVLDEVAIFNKALSEGDIQYIMENGLEKALSLVAVFPEDKLATTWAVIKKSE